MSGTFSSILFDAESRQASLECRIAFENVEDVLVKSFERRNYALDIAFEKLEEAAMWTNKALKVAQEARNVKSVEDDN